MKLNFKIMNIFWYDLKLSLVFKTKLIIYKELIKKIIAKEIKNQTEESNIIYEIF